MKSAGQSLVELAVAMPVVLVLAFGAAAIVRIADAKSGLDGATTAAVASGARQASADAAATCADRRFLAIAAAYGLVQPRLVLAGTFERGTYYTGRAGAEVDISFVPVGFAPRLIPISSEARAWVEPWRSRAGQPCGG